MNAPSNTGTLGSENREGEDAERFKGKDDKNTLWATAEHGAESTSVVIMNVQLLFSGAKQPPHRLT